MELIGILDLKTIRTEFDCKVNIATAHLNFNFDPKNLRLWQVILILYII